MRHKSTILSIPGILGFLFLILHLVGIIVYSAKATNDVDRVVDDNEYTKMWINVVGFVLVSQGLFVVSREYSSTRVLRTPLVWIIYSAIMTIFTIMLFASYISVGESGTAVWALTLLGGSLLCLVYSMKARRGYFVDSIMDIPHHRLVNENSGPADMVSGFMDYVFVWVTILFVFVFGFFLVLQGLWYAADRGNFPARGERVEVSVNHTDSYRLHVYCKGPSVTDKPTYVIHNEEGSPYTTLLALQSSLSNRNRRVCIYDRPGYGWSEPGYVAQTPIYVIHSLKNALESLNDKGPYIMLGYGAGGEYAQLFTHVYPTVVEGVGLIDSYPNRDALYAYAMNMTGTEAYDDYVSSVSNYFQSRRVISPMAWQRPLNDDFPGFQPKENLREHISLYSTNNHWQARYFEYDGCGCRAYQALQGFRDQNTTDYLRAQAWPFTWPALPKPYPSDPYTPDLPVLVIAANQTINKGCDSTGDSAVSYRCQTDLAEQNVLRRQRDLHVATLSNNIRSVECPGNCDHNLVYTSADWVSGEIVNWFG